MKYELKNTPPPNEEGIGKYIVLILRKVQAIGYYCDENESDRSKIHRDCEKRMHTIITTLIFEGFFLVRKNNHENPDLLQLI